MLYELEVYNCHTPFVYHMFVAYLGVIVVSYLCGIFVSYLCVSHSPAKDVPLLPSPPPSRLSHQLDSWARFDIFSCHIYNSSVRFNVLPFCSYILRPAALLLSLTLPRNYRFGAKKIDVLSRSIFPVKNLFALIQPTKRQRQILTN